jgi:hypothetical protein
MDQFPVASGTLGFALHHPRIADAGRMAAKAVVLQNLMRFRRKRRHHLVIAAEFVPHIAQAGFGLVEETFGKIAVRQMAFDAGELLVSAGMPGAMDPFHAVAGAAKSGRSGPLVSGSHHQQKQDAGHDAKQEQFPAVHFPSPPISQVLSFPFYIKGEIPAETNDNDEKI